MTVAVRVVDCEQPSAVVAELAVTLDPSERDRADAWSNPAARARWIVAHGALRSVLGAALGVEPADIAFDRTCRHCGDPKHGKPVVVGADIEFSLSHSGALAVIAWTRAAGRLGVDVELVRPRARLELLAARKLDPAEYAAWRALAPAERLPAFLRHWTAQEAYLKALGVGLFRTGGVPPVSPQWTVAPIDVGTGGVAALAVDKAAAPTPVPELWTAAVPSHDGRR
ncbi:MAG: 4'-phosphopantetheinyl transferase superfamily protein [Acidimicrobiia bacterium]